MKVEKIILSFVAVFVGLVAAGIAFYLYQSTKVVPTDQKKVVAVSSNPTKAPSPIDTNDFIVDEPKDEAVVTKKVITIKGKAVKDAIITVSTPDADQVVQPAENGEFTLTQTIPDDTSVLEISAIFPDGTEKKIDRTVTFSTESF